MITQLKKALLTVNLKLYIDINTAVCDENEVCASGASCE